jgi:hypothetical protein
MTTCRIRRWVVIEIAHRSTEPAQYFDCRRTDQFDKAFTGAIIGYNLIKFL